MGLPVGSWIWRKLGRAPLRAALNNSTGMATSDRRSWPFQIGREAGMTWSPNGSVLPINAPSARPFRSRLAARGTSCRSDHLGDDGEAGGMKLAKAVLDRMRTEEIGPAPSLVFSSDEEPGWRRRRRGTGFSYDDGAGHRPGKADLARIGALAIPPAWTDVWICRQAGGHIQATGRDEKGRKQYRYHPDWTAHRSASKFETLPAFARALPGLRQEVESDLRRRSLGYERV